MSEIKHTFLKKSGQLKKVEVTNKKKIDYLKAQGFIEVESRKGTLVAKDNKADVELAKTNAALAKTNEAQKKTIEQYTAANAAFAESDKAKNAEIADLKKQLATATKAAK